MTKKKLDIAEKPDPPAFKPGDLVVSRILGETRPAAWKCAFELPAAGTVGQAFRFKGWIVDRDAPVTEMLVIRESDETEIGRLQTGISREGVGAANPDVPHAATAGFDGRIAMTEPGRYRLEAAGAGRARTPLWTLSLRDPTTKPAKLLFMHIAKTAGTSVNRFLAETVGAAQCAFHLEIDERWQKPGRTRELAGKTVLSGHITHRMFMRRLDPNVYVKATMLRRPLDHVVSHLAFIRHLAEPSELGRLRSSPPAIQAFALKLAATDFGDRRTVKKLIVNLVQEELVLIDNCQVRYLSHVPARARVDKAIFSAACMALHEFDVVGYTEEMGAFLKNIAVRLGWPAPLYVPLENQNRNRHGIDPSNLGLRAALQPLIHFDEALYEYARTVFVNGDERPTNRLRKKMEAAKAAAAGDFVAAK